MPVSLASTYASSMHGAVVPIGFITVSGSSTTVLTFSSIPQNYQDLFVVLNARNAYSSISLSQVIPQFNNDGGANYSYTWLYGNGSSAASTRSSNANFTVGGTTSAAAATTGIFGSVELHILNYANTTTYKTQIGRSAADLNGSGQVDLTVSMWRQTSAINAISIGQSYGTAYVAGSSAALYGIRTVGQ